MITLATPASLFAARLAGGVAVRSIRAARNRDEADGSASLTLRDNCQFQLRAIGGATGTSGWSDPVSHMSL